VFLHDWLRAVAQAAALPEKQFPPLRAPRVGPPDHHNWERTNPEAHARLQAARAGVQDLAAKLSLPTENLLSPAALRALCWESVPEPTTQAISARLAELDARGWQRQLVAPVIASAFALAPQGSGSVG
jgi:ribonuclease D